MNKQTKRNKTKRRRNTTKRRRNKTYRRRNRRNNYKRNLSEFIPGNKGKGLFSIPEKIILLTKRSNKIITKITITVNSKNFIFELTIDLNCKIFLLSLKLSHRKNANKK